MGIGGGHTCFSLFDDSMISMTYARNIAHGEGFTWFPGYAPVEGYTNFLWVMIMAAVHLLPLPDGLTSLPIMLIGAGLLLAQNHLVWRITGHLAAGDERLRSAPVHACLLNAFCKEPHDDGYRCGGFQNGPDMLRSHVEHVRA